MMMRMMMMIAKRTHLIHPPLPFYVLYIALFTKSSVYVPFRLIIVIKLVAMVFSFRSPFFPGIYFDFVL